MPIDHSVAPVPGVEGGETAAGRVLDSFLSERLAAYGEGRNHLRGPDEDVTSTLSPYLHFGNISTHHIFAAVAEHERWTPARLAARSNGAREGWWGMGAAAAEKFLDELVTWREVGYNRAALQEDSERYESLPGWARATLEKHAADPRPELYDLAAFEAAATHDELWNAAQRQLVEASGASAGTTAPGLPSGGSSATSAI